MVESRLDVENTISKIRGRTKEAQSVKAEPACTRGEAERAIKEGGGYVKKPFLRCCTLFLAPRNSDSSPLENLIVPDH